MNPFETFNSDSEFQNPPIETDRLDIKRAGIEFSN